MLESFGGRGHASSRIWVLKVNPRAWGFMLVLCWVFLSAGESQSVCWFLVFLLLVGAKMSQSHRPCKSLLIVLLCSAWGMLSSLIFRQFNWRSWGCRSALDLFSVLLWMCRNVESCTLSAATLALVRVKIVPLKTVGITTLYRKQLLYFFHWNGRDSFLKIVFLGELDVGYRASKLLELPNAAALFKKKKFKTKNLISFCL